jgi:methyl-accepting chemotaxis protein
MIILGLASSVAIGFVDYKSNQQATLNEAREKGKLLYNYIQTSRKFFVAQQRPLIVDLINDKERFYPEIMSSFAIQRMETDIFNNNTEGYEYKLATLNPIWSGNKANPDEEKIINSFKQNPDLEKKDGRILKEGNAYYYIAKPVTVYSKKCLRCHGDPALAPKDQQEIYGTTNGYHWKLDDTVGISIIYVSIAKAVANSKNNLLFLMAIGLGSLLVTIGCIWLFLDRSIILPIIRFSAIAEDIGVGKNLDQPITVKSKDEIGALANSINRLQSSVKILLNRSIK